MRTTFGDGTIFSLTEGHGESGSDTKYKIEFEFGTGTISPCSVMHGLPQDDGPKYVRHDGVMEKESESTETNGSAVKIDKKFKLLFGSDRIYLLIRLFSFLVNMLDDVESYVAANPSLEAPESKYYNPIKSQEERKAPQLDFKSLIANLQRVVSKDMPPKDFEAYCRSLSKSEVHKMAALPKLVEKCADVLVQTAKEDLLLQLFDYCQFTGAVSIRCLWFGFFCHGKNLTNTDILYDSPNRIL